MRRLHWACVFCSLFATTAAAADPDPEVVPTAARSVIRRGG